MATFRELLQKNSYKKVFNEIYLEYYKGKTPEDKIAEADSKYLTVYNELLNIKSKSKTNLCIYLVQAKSFDEEDFIDVCLYDEDSDEVFAMDFTDWSEIIDMEVRNTIKISDVKVLSHIMWEITFWGFSQAKIKDQADLLDKD